MIFDIKRYAINDGPGIRITLFFKGCPLSCVWCHNPEGISLRKQKLYTRKKCLGCMACVEACPNHALRCMPEGIITDASLCSLCGLCAEACPSLALELSGRAYSAEELMQEIRKETLVMDQSGGGVTFCGGEPLMHPVLLSELLYRCGAEGIHRAIDTTLYARPELVRQLMPHTDLFLVDLKLMDSALHKKYCGVPNELILSNLRMLAEAGKEFIIRIPLINGINADEENIRQSAVFLASLPWKHKVVNLLPYHDIGKNKHEKLATVYNPLQFPMSVPSKEQIRRYTDLFHSYGIEAKEGG